MSGLSISQENLSVSFRCPVKVINNCIERKRRKNKSDERSKPPTRTLGIDLNTNLAVRQSLSTNCICQLRRKTAQQTPWLLILTFVVILALSCESSEINKQQEVKNSKQQNQKQSDIEVQTKLSKSSTSLADSKLLKLINSNDLHHLNHQRKEQFDRILALAANNNQNTTSKNAKILKTPRISSTNRQKFEPSSDNEQRNSNSKLSLPARAASSSDYQIDEPGYDAQFSAFRQNKIEQQQHHAANDNGLGFDSERLNAGQFQIPEVKFQESFEEPQRQQHHTDAFNEHQPAQFENNHRSPSRNNYLRQPKQQYYGRSLADFTEHEGNQPGRYEEHNNAQPQPAIETQHKSASIRVVFNNSPQFIIGQDQHALSRKTRQPASSLSGLDEYNPDESSPEATKLVPSKTSFQSTKHQKTVPCNRGTKSLAPKMEQIDLNNQEPIVTPIKQESAVKTTQQQQLDQQVDTPFEQIVKSGLRPPLRMVISMRNKNGDMMKVPINLHGKTPIQSKSKQQVKGQIEPTVEITQQPMIVEQQQQQQQEEQQDENTPVGGDVFDPSIVKPFSKTSTKKKTTTIVQQTKTTPVDTPQIQLPEPQVNVIGQEKQTEQSFQQDQEDEQQSTKNETPQRNGKTQPKPGVKVKTAMIEPPLTKQIQQKDCDEKQTKTVIEDINIDDEQQQQQQQEVGDAKGGDVGQMIFAPAMAALQNKTIADMFAQFQKALTEQMTEQQQQQEAQELVRDENQDLYQTKRMDNQEDLMVAVMAARDKFGSPQGDNKQSTSDEAGQMTMTVIKPPKGTSLEEAIREHSQQNSADPTRTVAILQSVRSKLGDNRSVSTKETAEAPNTLPRFAQNEPMTFEPVAVDVMLRPAPRSRTTSDSDQPASVDPDGFSSSSSQVVTDYSIPEQRPIYESPSRTSQSVAPRRFKRESAPLLTSLLEPEDKLTYKLPSWSDRKRFEEAARKKDLEAQHSKAEKSETKQKDQQVVSSSKHQRTLSNKKKPRDEIDAAASESSHQNELSDDDSDLDSNEDESDNLETNHDEAQSAPVETTSNANGDSDLDTDMEASDMNDDMADEGSNFDGEDEPYNQGASSERDYNSPSFEIPKIDINPDSLRQNGCRTVLREVQEIPMNGLGVVRANGQPGSGYESSASNSIATQHQLPGVRVRRQANNDNLINSRKVTSIVMTKECHFPNDQSVDQKKEEIEKKQKQKQQPSAPNPLQHRQIGSVSLESVNQAQFNANNKQQQQQQQQRMLPKSALQNRQIFRHQFHAEPSQQAYFGQDPRLIEQIIKAQNFQASQQQQPKNAYILPLHQQIQLNALMHPPHQQGDMMNRHQPPKRRSVETPAAATLKRPQMNTSERQNMPNDGSKSIQQNYRNEKRAQVLDKDLYVGADTRRNEVVARKLYKPPSRDDPYHTLSYSSRNGNDPDGDDEDGENVNEKEMEKPASRPSATTRKLLSETLSDREREAMLDPDHDDTDPRPINRGPSSDNDDLESPSNRQTQDSDDADDLDSDMMDESRVNSAAIQRDAINRRNQHQDQRERHYMKPEQIGHRVQIARDAKHLLPDSSAQRRTPRQASPLYHHKQQVPLRAMIREESTHLGSYNSGQMPMRQQLAPLQRQRQQMSGDPKYGKSFKFEHRIERPQARGLMAQLRHLSPASQGFVAIDGVAERERSSAEAYGDHLNWMAASRPRRAQKKPINRRQEGQDEDSDEADYLDDDDEPATATASSNKSKRRRAHSKRGEDEPEKDEEDDPDSDPDYNPKESYLPAQTKPKKIQKSFAYVHRDLPKKGSKNDDDFVVSYGRGNLQTEQEDYDSDRDTNNPVASGDSSNEDGRGSNKGSERGAASELKLAHLVAPQQQQQQLSSTQRRASIDQQYQATYPQQQQQLNRQIPSKLKHYPNVPIQMRFG